MKRQKLGILSKIVLFVLPLLLVVIVATALIFELVAIGKTNKNIKDTQYLADYYKDILSDSNKIAENNKERTDNLLNTAFGYETANFEDYWNYDIYIVYGNTIKDINSELVNREASDPSIISFKENISVNQSNVAVPVKLYFIESCNFDCGGYQGSSAFPQEIIDSCSANGISEQNRIRQYTEEDLGENSFYNANNVSELEINLIESEKASTTILEIKFNLISSTSSFKLEQLPLFWFDSRILCTAIEVKGI